MKKSEKDAREAGNAPKHETANEPTPETASTPEHETANEPTPETASTPEHETANESAHEADHEAAHHHVLPSARFNEKHGIAGPELFWLFFFGSLLGVLLEGFYCKFVHGYWETHVVSIWGPFCILYGIGAVVFYVGNVVWEDKKKWQKFLLFGCLGSGLEVIFGAILEFGMGMYAWDYSEQFLNFRGYVSLGMTLAWGALGLLFSLAVPRIDAVYRFMQNEAWHIAYVILAILMTIDLAFTVLCLARWAGRKYDWPAVTKLSQFIDEKYDDEYMQHRFIEWHPIEWKR